MRPYFFRALVVNRLDNSSPIISTGSVCEESASEALKTIERKIADNYGAHSFIGEVTLTIIQESY